MGWCIEVLGHLRSLRLSYFLQDIVFLPFLKRETIFFFRRSRCLNANTLGKHIHPSILFKQWINSKVTGLEEKLLLNTIKGT